MTWSQPRENLEETSLGCRIDRVIDEARNVADLDTFEAFQLCFLVFWRHIRLTFHHCLRVVFQDRALFGLLGEVKCIVESVLDTVLAFFDATDGGGSAVENFAFLGFEHLNTLLVINDCLLVELDQFGNVFADNVGQD